MTNPNKASTDTRKPDLNKLTNAPTGIKNGDHKNSSNNHSNHTDQKSIALANKLGVMLIFDENNNYESVKSMQSKKFVYISY